MKTRKDPDRRQRPNLNQHATEMIGLLELGLKNDALAIAQTVLSSNSFNKYEFVAALAVIMENDSPKAYESRVTTAYAKLSKASQRWASCKMFQFYIHVDEADAAANYIPNFYVESGNLLQSMMTLLSLKRVNEAKRIFRMAKRQLQKATSDYERSNLIAAIAEFHTQAGELDEAERFWMMAAKFNGPSFLSAIPSLVKIQVVRALRFVESGIDITEEFARQDSEKMPPVHPIEDKASRFTIHKLEEYREVLLEIVPKENLWRYGMEIKTPGANAEEA